MGGKLAEEVATAAPPEGEQADECWGEEWRDGQPYGCFVGHGRRRKRVLLSVCSSARSASPRSAGQ